MAKIDPPPPPPPFATLFKHPNNSPTTTFATQVKSPFCLNLETINVTILYTFYSSHLWHHCFIIIIITFTRKTCCDCRTVTTENRSKFRTEANQSKNCMVSQEVLIFHNIVHILLLTYCLYSSMSLVASFAKKVAIHCSQLLF